jgi:LacI family transcriptional regulator
MTQTPDGQLPGASQQSRTRRHDQTVGRRARRVPFGDPPRADDVGPLGYGTALQGQPVTIYDVAAAAGVSVASVSRVLTGSRSVKPETFRRAKDAADKLGYQINPLASALRGKLTRSVGMVVPDLTNPFFPAVVKAVEDVLHLSGISLFLCDSGNSPEMEAERIAALLLRGVDGVLISPVDEVRSRPAVVAAMNRVPLVQIDRNVNVPGDMVSVDHARGISMVISHLAASGRRSFAFVTTAERSSIATERRRAYIREVRLYDRVSSRRVLAGDLSIAWGRAAAERLIDAGLPQAVVCANDLIALGVLKTFRERQVAIPEQVAVTGYDDSLFADVAEPPLTSVRQPLSLLGGEAVRCLSSAIESSDHPRREIRLIPELIVRSSSGSERLHGADGRPALAIFEALDKKADGSKR